MITWGIISTCFVLVVGPQSFYWLRMLLGAAEAGFFPGIMFYLSLWVPHHYRKRGPKRWFFLSTACAAIISNILGGYILYFVGKFHLPYQPWQWLFLLEGIPSVILGVVVFFYLN